MRILKQSELCERIFDEHLWRTVAPAGDFEIEHLRAWWGRSLPEDFEELLRCSNGGEGPLGSINLRILGTGEVAVFDANYEISQRLGQFVLPVGTDGGDLCLIYDLRDASRPQLLSVPLGALDFDEAKLLGVSLRFVIAAISSGEITSANIW